MFNQSTSPSKIRVAVASPWKTIHPGLQHTLVADLVLGNQFEALVGANDNGVSVPLAATSWDVSEDFKVFRFHIDTSKTFSDGTPLEAGDFKRSWESALKLDPNSANNSLLDVLYKIEGFEDFAKTGTIAGLRVIDSKTLELRFKSPFRMALEHLQGNRFAAYKEQGERYYGTGLYEIEEIEANKLVLHPRKDLKDQTLSEIELTYLPSDKIYTALENGTIDAIAYAIGTSLPLTLSSNSEIEVIVGEDAIHVVLGLNTTTSSILHDRNLRSAMQYLVLKGIEKHKDAIPNSQLFEFDPQIFMPVQAGRVEPEMIAATVNSGEQYVDDLIARTKQKPLLVHVGETTKGLLQVLREAGLTLSVESKVLTQQESIKAFYAPNGADVVGMTFGIASGDPDGMYHKLGRSGAIMTPYVFSERVSDLLEEGRKIVDTSAIDPFYRKITYATLEEAPLIHLGFAKAVMVIRNDRVAVDTTVLRRNQGQLHILKSH